MKNALTTVFIIATLLCVASCNGKNKNRKPVNEYKWPNRRGFETWGYSANQIYAVTVKPRTLDSWKWGF